MQLTESERLTILIQTLIDKKIVYNQSDFCKKIGKKESQISSFKNNYAKRPLDVNKLFTLIVSKFPFINIEWMETGEGEMFLKDNFETNETDVNVSVPKVFLDTINKQADAITSQQRMIEKQTDTINSQLEIIKILASELKKTSSAIVPREDAGCAAAG